MATWTKYDAPLRPSMMRRMGFLKPTSSCATWVASDGKKGHGYFAASKVRLQPRMKPRPPLSKGTRLQPRSSLSCVR